MEARRSVDGKYRVSLLEGLRITPQSTATAEDTGEILRPDTTRPIRLIGALAGGGAASTVTLNAILWFAVFERQFGIYLLILTLALLASLLLGVGALASQMVTFTPLREETT